MALRDRVISKFPAIVTADNGIGVAKENGSYRFHLDLVGLGETPIIADTEKTKVLLYTPDGDPAQQGISSLVSVEDLLTQGLSPSVSAIFDAAFSSIQGAVLYRGASAWSALPPGASGAFLKTLGAGANPAWSSIPGGGDVFAANRLTDVNYLSAGTGAVARTYASKIADHLSVKDFGAKGDGVEQIVTITTTNGSPALTVSGFAFSAADVGKTIYIQAAGAASVDLVTTIAAYTDPTHVTLTANAGTTIAGGPRVIFLGTDDTAAVNAAVVAGGALNKAVYAPGAQYLIAGTVTVQANILLYGDGKAMTVFKSPNASNPIIVVGNGLGDVRLRGFGTDRPFTRVATAGGNGIEWANTSISDGSIIDTWNRRSYDGCKLGPTAISMFEDNRCENNVRHGVLQTNNAAFGGSQWYARNNYCGSNGADGWSCRSSVSAVQSMPVGGHSKLFTFGNTGHGYAAIGLSASPIPSVRMVDSFLGQDGASEIYLDTYGSDHLIADTFVELCGTALTGPAGTTPVSNVGHGIEATVNNIDLMINDCLVVGNKQSGIVYNSATGVCQVTNSFIKYNTNYGVVSQNGDRMVLNGCVFTGNGSGEVFITTNSGLLVARGCTPTTVNRIPVTFYTPTNSGSATGTAQGQYSRDGNRLFLAMRFIASSTGTIVLSLPAGMTAASLGINQYISGRDVGASAKGALGTVNGSTVTFALADNSATASTALIDVSGTIYLT